MVIFDRWKSPEFILVHLQTLSFAHFHFPGTSMAIILKVNHLPNTNTKRLGQGEGGVWSIVNGKGSLTQCMHLNVSDRTSCIGLARLGRTRRIGLVRL